MMYTRSALIAFVLLALEVCRGEHSCFERYCGTPQGALDATCLQDWTNGWICHHNQFCEITIDEHGVDFDCRSTNEQEKCLRNQQCSVTSDSSHSSCSLCCTDRQCILDLLSQPRSGSPSPGTYTPQVYTLLPPASSAVLNVAMHGGNADSCFASSCQHGDTLGTCISGENACHAGKFCKMTVNHNGDIHMHCSDDHELLHCLERTILQGQDCSPLTYPPSTDCHFCCLDADCVRHIFNPQAATTTVTPISRATTVGGGGNQAAGHSLVPGSKSCFTSDCDHGVTADQCMSGQYACPSDQYCKVNAHHSGVIDMHCEGQDKLSSCLVQQQKGGSACSLPLVFPRQHDCHLCCLDAACLRNIFGIANNPTTSILTTPPPTAVPTAHTHTDRQTDRQTASTILPTTPHPTTAAAGATAAFKTSAATTTTTAAAATTPSHATECTDMYSGDCSIDFAGNCSRPEVQLLCPKFCGLCTGSGNTGSCTDKYLGDCSVDFAGQCGNPTVADVCQKTCNRCDAWDCSDHYRGNCSVDYAGRCSDPVISQVCQKTCGLCNQPPTPTGACVDKLPNRTCSEPQIAGACATQTIRDVCPVTCKVCPGCVDLLPGSTCSEPQMANSCSQQAIRDVCPATCNACPGQGQAAVLSATQAPPPPETSAAQAPRSPETTTTTRLSCKQCGHYGNGTACTDAELLLDELKLCDDVTASFCMTDAIVDVNSKVSIYKRCVSHAACEHQWYRQTSDKAACLNFNPSSVTPDLACHFCCVGVGCNANIVPPRDVQWRP